MAALFPFFSGGITLQQFLVVAALVVGGIGLIYLIDFIYQKLKKPD